MQQKNIWSIAPSSGTRRRIRQGVTLAGRYKVVGRLPSQGRCDRYAVHDLITERHFTLILPRTEDEGGYTSAQRAELTGDALRLLTLGSSGICLIDVLDVGDQRGFLTDQWVRCSAAQMIDEYGAMDERRALHIMTQVAAVMMQAHAIGVTHKNLAPQCVFIRPGDEHAAVCDFGLFAPRSEPDSAGEFTLTEANTEIHLSPYLPPEVTDGELEAPDTQGDVWSFGVTLHYLVAGRLPFAHESLSAMTLSIPEVDPEQLTQMVASAGMRNVIMGCLQTDRSRRFRDMATVHQCLEALRQRAEDAAGPPDSWARRVVNWSRRSVKTRSGKP